MRKTDRRKAISLLGVLGLLVTSVTAASAVTVASPGVAAPQPPGLTYKVLVLTAAGSSSTATAGVDAVKKLGNERRFSVEVTDDARKFDRAHLQQYRVVVFLDTAGRTFTADQRTSFEEYFHEGGGFVGLHSAIQTDPGWQFLTDVLGARAGSAAATAAATVKVADRVHPASSSLPEYWPVTDAFYNFSANVRGVSHVLATVDEKSYTGGTMGYDHPIMWCKDYKGGRSFYTGLGGTAAQYADAKFTGSLGGAIAWASGQGGGDCGATVLANYEQTVIAAPPNIGEPIEFDVLPDGRVIQTARTGEVRLHNPATGTTSIIATIPVYTHDEDGLYGGSIDADFATNHWVYLYYAPPLSTPTTNAPTSSTDPNAWDVYRGYNQLSRFKFVEQPTPHLDPASEQKILQVGTDRGACCHVAGEIRFDSHGNLLMVTGDDTPAGSGNSGGFSPFNDELTVTPTASCPDPCYNAPYVDARRSAGNTNDLRGKLLRIHVEPDGSYTIPGGNLFPAGTAGARPEIYAMGFRNPFRLNLDANDVAYLTDYSPDAQTPTVFRGPAGTGRMEIVRQAANYGWPFCVAPELPYYKWNFAAGTTQGEPFDCANPAKGPDNTSRWNTGLVQTPPLTKPDLWYSYQDNNATTPLGTPCPAYYTTSPPGTCPQLFPQLLTGGVGPHGAAPYKYDPANPNPAKFPEYYDKAIFFGEFTRDFLREIRLDSQGRIFLMNDLLSCGDVSANRAVRPFICDAPMDMRWGPDGTFYLLSYGDGFFRANPDALLVKFSYVKGTHAPTAVLSATPTSGHAPLTVAFSSAGTNDRDPGDSIKFGWDFTGDGTVDSIDPDPSFTYTANGVYTAKLTVTDSSGKSSTASTAITVGNTAPTVKITGPVDGGFFSWGDKIPWSVSASDPEDPAIDCARVSFSFALGHDSHGHGEGTQTGCTGVYQTDPADATHATGYLYGGLTAAYTDLGANGQPALTGTDQITVQQKRQELEYAVDQLGTATTITTDPAGGALHRNSLDPGDWIAVNRNVNLLNMTSVTFRVSGGSTATAGTPRAQVELRLDAPTGPLVSTVTINATTGNNDFVSQQFPIADPGGTHRLYLVFRPVSGGPASNLFNLNWIEFGGPGVGTP
jgi:cytochrome c